MKSPFPGIDPYLEQHWGDVHTSLMVYIRDQITDQLPVDLQARVEESVSVDVDETSRPSEVPTQRHIEIVDLNSGNRVVTAIELLSPVNKQEEAGRTAYRRKQREYIEGGVNLVEIDFIRSGSFIVAAPEGRIPWDKRTPYIVCIRRSYRPEQAEIIPIGIDQSIPSFRIPLRPNDADIVLKLQPLLDDCYRRGRYASIDYSHPPRPRLDDKTARWAEELLRRADAKSSGSESA